MTEKTIPTIKNNCSTNVCKNNSNLKYDVGAQNNS